MNIIVTLILMLFSWNVLAFSPVKQLHVNDVYSTTWYEIARTQNTMQKNCEHSRFIYSNLEGDTFKSTMQCLRNDGTLKSAFAKAYINPNKTSEISLQYYLKWLDLSILQNKLWVVKYNKNFEYLIISTPQKKALWVLAKSKTIEPNLLVQVLKWLQGNGFDLRDLVIDNTNIVIDWPKL